MAIALITGTPGAGKTLYSLAVFVPGWLKPLVTESGGDISRRLCAGNIRDLLLDHELVDVPRIRDWDEWARDPVIQKWGKCARLPGDPPVADVPRRADLWWLWCEPGDVIVLDEAQHVFKPMAAGRALPPHITNLEEHRHYGVDFLLITQHGNLLHSNVRQLINPHLHVRRLFGRKAAAVYEFDRCTNTGSLRQALSKKVWWYDKKAFSIYKSSELHTKQARGIPWQLWLLGAAVLSIPALLWNAVKRTDRMLGGGPVAASAPGASASAPLQPGLAASGPVQDQRPLPLPRRGTPAFVGVVAARQTWPDLIAGCWLTDAHCVCVTQEQPPRLIEDRPALCQAVAAGLLIPPETHAAPVPPAPPASAPVSASSASSAQRVSIAA